VRSKDFSFGFAKNISKFVILRRNIRKVRSLCVRLMKFGSKFLLIFFSFLLVSILETRVRVEYDIMVIMSHISHIMVTVIVTSHIVAMKGYRIF